jgi:hypothetical protein
LVVHHWQNQANNYKYLVLINWNFGWYFTNDQQPKKLAMEQKMIWRHEVSSF